MDAHLMVQSYDRYGGHLTLSMVGQLIEEHLQSAEHGISVFEGVACFRTNRPPRRTLEDLQGRFHAGLTNLPTARWEQKKGRLSVRYASQLGLAEEVLDERRVSADLLERAIRELELVLHGLAPKLERKKGLRLQAFLDGLASIRTQLPGSSDTARALRDSLAAKKKEERSKLPWDEQMGIDWSDYHPSAREKLNDPFFWSEADDYSPHGNDTGADLLAAFRKWNQTHSRSPSRPFLDHLLSSWGMAQAINAMRSRGMSVLSSEDEINLVVHEQAVIALAFAEIKLRGECSAQLASEALQCLQRAQDTEFRKTLGWPPPAAEHIVACRKLLVALQNYKGA